MNETCILVISDKNWLALLNLRYGILIILLSLVLKVLAQEQVVLPRLSDKIIFDGQPNETAWKDIEPLPLVTIVPEFGKEPSEKTEILLAYDDDYLYLAGRLYTDDPSTILATSKKRDLFSGNNDWFGIIIDTFNDKENGLGFFTTPEGIRLDLTVFNDAQGDLPLNPSWNTFWDVKSIRNGQGWFTEMRIPFSSLRFQEKDGEVVMGIITWRFMARQNETAIYPAIPFNWGPWSGWKPSQAQEVVFKDLRAKKPLYLAPYVLGGIEQTNDLNETNTNYLRNDDLVTEAGIDVKYGLTNNLTLDVTVNTDFAQVEADDQQVNLTRFSLFFPEKRLFFQERSSTFDFNLGGPNQLFYSRRIGIYEEELVRIYGGVRLVGRAGPWDIGFLDMQTEASDKLPSTNWGVFRARKQVFNENSYIGGIITNKVNKEEYNTAYGVDGIFRLFGQDFLRMSWAQTFEDSIQNRNFDNWRFRVNWEKRSIRGFGYNISVSGAGEDYDPEMGFELREDYLRLGNQIWWGWVMGENSKILNQQALIQGSVFRRNSDGSIQSGQIGPAYRLNFKNNSFTSLSVKRFYEDVDEEFDFSDNDDAVIPVGSYSFYGVEGTIGSSGTKPFFLVTDFYAGSFFDGNRFSITLSPTWNLSPSLEIGASYQYNRVDLPERDQQFIAHLPSFKSLLMFSTKVSLSMFVQYNSAEDIAIGNLRLRYNPREGNDLYLVYNEGLNSNRQREVPNLPTTDSRSILIKYTYTFNL